MSQPSQFSLLKQRRFAPFFWTQFLGAFNDNVFKTALLVILTYDAARWTSVDPGLLNNLIPGLFILPYVLFSATAGQIAEKVEKSRLARFVKWLEIGIMLVAGLGWLTHSLPLLLAAVFGMGVHSTLFGPVKYAYLPQHLRQDEIVGGNGVVEMGTFVGILLGQILGAALVQYKGIGVELVAGATLLFAIMGLAVSYRIPLSPAPEPDLVINRNPFSESVRNIAFSSKNRTVFLSMLGNSWFWFYGALILSQFPLYAKNYLHGDYSVFVLLLTVFSVGVGAGSLLCEKLSGHKVEIGLVPFGSIGLSLFGIELYFASVAYTNTASVTMAGLIAAPGALRILFDIAMLGVFGGLFIVPLFALIQTRCDPKHLSRTIGGMNILNALFMIAAAGAAIVMIKLGFSIPEMFLATAILNAIVALYIFSLVPEFLMRFMAWMLIHTIHRVKTVDVERIPDEGPAVLVCNHVSYVDAIVIGAASPRPIRFVMDHRIFKTPFLGWIFRTARAIPIAPAKEDPWLMEKAYIDIAKALHEGDLVCIFPEGKLTTTGEMNEFRGGVAKILERSKVPVIPMALRGLWGSMLTRDKANLFERSFSRGLRSRLALAVGAPVAPEQATPEYLQQQVLALRGEWKSGEMQIRAYLALMVAAILIPVILFSTLSLNMLLTAEREAALKGVRETARISLVSIDRELSNTESAVHMLAASPYLVSGDLAAFYRQAQYADKIGATWTTLLDDKGQQLLNTAIPYGTPLPPPAAAARVAKVLATGKPQISNLIRGIVTQALLVVVDVPVTTPDGKRFVIAQAFKVEHFSRVLRQVNPPAGWLAGVYDRNGMTIAQSSSGNAAERGESHADLREAIRNQTVGVIRNASGDQQKLYTVLERSALSGWTVAVGVPEAEIEMAARDALLVSMLGLFAAIACAAVAALFFARRLSHSIRLAARSAYALEHDEPMGEVEESGVVEVDEVQGAIAAAAAVVRTEKQSRKLAETERELMFAREHEARTMVEQQNRAKDEFLAMLGHELRNPLAAIVNATQVMAHPTMSADAVARARQIVTRQSGHLTRIVDDLLDMGRVHSGKILLERRLLRIDRLVADYMAGMSQSQRGARHAISVSTSTAWVDADPTRMEQIIANLLDNAVKYTPPGGHVTVSVYPEGEQVVLRVADTGIGIAEELRPYVFDLFVQGQRALDRAQGGLGVGLAMVRQLAAMHGGSVSVASDGVGKGSCFEVRLPLVQAPEGETAAPPATAPTRQTVLLIEDNDDGRDMMTMMLEAQHYQVVSAADGLAGLALAAQQVPDVALVDIGLPGIDGYEVARRLRADPATSAMRLIALTGYGQESDRLQALAAGFDTHLVKPVALTALIAALESAALAQP